MRNPLLALLVCALCEGASPEQQILDAEQAWAKAVVARDLAALERIFTPELIYAHSSGKIETRQLYLDRLREGKQRYDEILFEKTQVRIYGDFAVSHSIARTVGKNDNGPFNDHLMMMHFWVKRDGAWRLAAHQTTKIP